MGSIFYFLEVISNEEPVKMTECCILIIHTTNICIKAYQHADVILSRQWATVSISIYNYILQYNLQDAEIFTHFCLIPQVLVAHGCFHTNPPPPPRLRLDRKLRTSQRSREGEGPRQQHEERDQQQPHRKNCNWHESYLQGQNTQRHKQLHCCCYSAALQQPAVYCNIPAVF